MRISQVIVVLLSFTPQLTLASNFDCREIFEERPPQVIIMPVHQLPPKSVIMQVSNIPPKAYLASLVRTPPAAPAQVVERLPNPYLGLLKTYDFPLSLGSLSWMGRAFVRLTGTSIPTTVNMQIESMLPINLHLDPDMRSLMRRDYLKSGVTKWETRTSSYFSRGHNIVEGFGIQNFASVNGPIETELIRLSNINVRPVEWGQIIVYDRNFRIIEKSVAFTNDNRTQISGATIAEYFDHSISKVNPVEIGAIEFLHTHPSFEYDPVGQGSEAGHALQSSLSPDDLHLRSELQRRVGAPVVISAVLPAGYKYSSDGLRSPNVTLLQILGEALPKH